MYSDLAYDAYKHYQPAGKEEGFLPLVTGGRVLEIGIGNLGLMRALKARGCSVHGIDVGHDIIEAGKAEGFTNLHLLDVSEAPIPYPDDYFDAVYCYEVFEHLTNPHRLFYEIRRTLKQDHLLFFSVPCQETDMGYGQFRHPFIYPGLLIKEHLERFIMQMYFRIEFLFEPPGRLIGRSYILRNQKAAEKPDIVHVVPSDHTVQELYADSLTPEGLSAEIARETGEYLRIIREDAQVAAWGGVEFAFKVLAEQYGNHAPIFTEFEQILLTYGDTHVARQVYDSLLSRSDLSEWTQERVRELRDRLPDHLTPAPTTFAA